MKMLAWRQWMVMEQRQWIKEHGSTLPGYVARYGTATDPEHYGNGGEAIYQADVQALENLEFRLARLERSAVR